MKQCLIQILLATLATLTLQGCASPQESRQIERNLLLESTTSWDGTSYSNYPDAKPELSVLRLSIPANTQLQWHTHPIPNAAYILSGELTIESRDDGRSKRFKQGEAVAEMVNRSHRGITGDKPVELVVFYAGGEGIPLSE
ncbi:cupin domain-containing protein [Pseudomonas fluorescens]|uniref:Cupin n=1 Tax=Pseudomonas fluorescens TaxID=294 RepID=A0A7Z3C0P7_PSEFL|nr:cupin domain-containing protein [Pseudomonas fluorescens]QJP93356.1 cupin [Pseudomonas fluorescens]